VRRGEGTVEARERADGGPGGPLTRLAAADLAGLVRAWEQEPVRWVWDDTTRWYPALLAAGVRVERCTDLRLTPAVLRRSPFVDQSLLAADETAGWDALQPVTAPDPALFPRDDPADRLDPTAEHERQRGPDFATAPDGWSDISRCSAWIGLPLSAGWVASGRAGGAAVMMRRRCRPDTRRTRRPTRGRGTGRRPRRSRRSIPCERLDADRRWTCWCRSWRPGRPSLLSGPPPGRGTTATPVHRHPSQRPPVRRHGRAVGRDVSATESTAYASRHYSSVACPPLRTPVPPVGTERLGAAPVPGLRRSRAHEAPRPIPVNLSPSNEPACRPRRVQPSRLHCRYPSDTANAHGRHPDGSTRIAAGTPPSTTTTSPNDPRLSCS
jgi:hypothetical protein